MFLESKNFKSFLYGILGAIVFNLILLKFFKKENFTSAGGSLLEVDKDGNIKKTSVPKDLVTRSSGVLAGGNSQWNPGKAPTHFPYNPNKQNYIRGDTNIDGNVVFNGHLNLHNKWRISGRGDGHGNDGWLRLMDKTGKNYHGGLAAGNLWSNTNVYAKNNVSAENKLCIGDTCINEKHLQVLAGTRKLLLKQVGYRTNECLDCGRKNDNCHINTCSFTNKHQPFLVMSDPAES